MTESRSRETVWQRLCELLLEVGKVDPSSIQEQSVIGEDFSLESVAFVEIAVSLEEELDIEIDPLEVLERDNLGDIVDYILALVACSSGPADRAAE